MKIPKILRLKGNTYIFKKRYPNFLLYQEVTGFYECFSIFGLIDIKRRREKVLCQKKMKEKTIKEKKT